METQSHNQHTVRGFDSDITHLTNLLMEMGGLARKQLQKSLKALKNEDLDLAKKVLKREEQINNLEIEIDANVARLIAKRQPMASDLRLLMSISKSVIDLERIGDEARKIARLTLKFYDGQGQAINSALLRDVYTMSKLAQELLDDALECLSTGDADEAMVVARSGDELNQAFSDALRRLTTFLLEDSRSIGQAIDIIFLVKALERIGDHAMNLAEYIVYALKGEDIRHLDPEKVQEILTGSGDNPTSSMDE